MTRLSKTEILNASNGYLPDGWYMDPEKAAEFIRVREAGNRRRAGNLPYSEEEREART